MYINYTVIEVVSCSVTTRRSRGHMQSLLYKRLHKF